MTATKSKLTKLEKFQFSLTQSVAETVPAQRAAIAREGLKGATPASVRKARREAFDAWLPTQKDLVGLPVWIAAARWQASGDDWLHVYPEPAKAGFVADYRSELGAIAHDSIDWGRNRKHSRGDSTAFAPRVREESNGKSGWDRVVFRYADYLAVINPQRTKIAVQVRGEDKIQICAYRNRRFFFEGQLIAPPRRVSESYKLTIRDTMRRMRNAGFEAKLVRQTADMVSSGSGESLRRGDLYCVVADGLGGWYHCQLSDSPERVRRALADRRINSRNAELDALIKSQPARIWVSVEDSLAAGNCKAGTQNFVSTVLEKLQPAGEIGAVRADVLLSIRNDDFTRRAARVAALRLARV
jgi:hypothetical protein